MRILFPAPLLFCFLLAKMPVTAQVNANRSTRVRFDFNKGCSYDGVDIKDDIYSFASSEDALEVVNIICKTQGISPKFSIVAANVPNACALIQNGIRYIFYSENFIHQIKQKSNTYWSAISVLAHEIGHHVDGHTIDTAQRRPEDELEADKFSGNVLRRLGATLEQAQSAINALDPHDGYKDYYPPKSARLEAIAIGYRDAGTQGPVVIEETITAATVMDNITLHVRKDYQDKLTGTNQIAYNYYLTGEQKYLNQIKEVRYVRNHNTFVEYTNHSYQSSTDGGSGFNFKGYQWGYITDVYITIVLNDGTTSEKVLKTINYDN